MSCGIEIQANASEASLNELLGLSVRKARRYKDEMMELQKAYEAQLLELREMVGDYTDKLELQQNAFKRSELVTESARAESEAYRKSADLLQDRLTAAQAQLIQLQQEAEDDANPFANLMSLFTGGKK